MAPNNVFYAAPQRPPMQAGWAGPRPPPRQQDWRQQDRVPWYAPNHPVPQNRNYDSRFPDEDFEEDDLDEDDQAQNYHAARTRPSNRRRGAFRGDGRGMHMQGDNREGYDSDERLQRPHRPQRGDQRYDTGDVFMKPRPTRGRPKPHERPYESDPEGRFGRKSYRGRRSSDDHEDRSESRDRRMEDEGGATDGA